MASLMRGLNFAHRPLTRAEATDLEAIGVSYTKVQVSKPVLDTNILSNVHAD